MAELPDHPENSLTTHNFSDGKPMFWPPPSGSNQRSVRRSGGTEMAPSQMTKGLVLTALLSLLVLSAAAYLALPSNDAHAFGWLEETTDYGDTPETATELPFNTVANGRINPDDDIDYFRLQVTETVLA